jgi:transposase InsO family protein
MTLRVGAKRHRGVQYASTAYVERLTEIGAQVSMSAKGIPYDNAKAESFFKTLKREEVYLNQYETFADAEGQLGRFIDDVYNLVVAPASPASCSFELPCPRGIYLLRQPQRSRRTIASRLLRPPGRGGPGGTAG